MTKLKYLQNFLILLFVGSALCAVQACGDDEEDEPIQEPNEEEVVKPDEEPNKKPGDENENHSYDNGEIAKIFRGTGTENDPYIISSAAELRKLANDVNSGMKYKGEYFRMTKNITFNRNVLDEEGNLKGHPSEYDVWTPIGAGDNTSFNGIFDGGGFTISGLYIPSGSLFANIPTLKNLTLKDSYIGSGAFAGNSGTIINCHNYATAVYGITYSNRGLIEKCSNYGRCSKAGIAFRCWGVVNETLNAGIVDGVGFVDQMFGEIRNSANLGIVSSYGFSHYLHDEGELYPDNNPHKYPARIRNCLNAGKIKSESEKTAFAGFCYVISSLVDDLDMFIENNVNYAECEVADKENTVGIVYRCAQPRSNKSCIYISNNYYIETFSHIPWSDYRNWLSDVNKWEAENNRCLSAKEMKEDSFLDELNANARKLGADYCKWKKGKGGLPILEWME
ncbi:MAG: hypothetical protein IKJ42_05470 [Bacteroidaceae bacterium]|nr:hypothetical protein [Bacteroidaceae bacterium]